MRARMAVDVAFDWPLREGRCVGIWLPEGVGFADDCATTLAAEEQAVAAGFGPVRRRTWVGGRAAMREALARSCLVPCAVLADDRGAPVLPSGVTGSISHKDFGARGALAFGSPRGLAVALVAREASARVGVDVELGAARALRSADIAPHVLTDDELAELARWEPEARNSEVLLRFSAKEALYKALDPFVRRYVAFREVAVTPLPDGSSRVQLRLRKGEGPFRVVVRWQRFDALVVTTARVEPGEG